MNVSDAVFDPELGYTGFTVQRTTYSRQNGSSVPSNETMSAAGTIHPGTPEMIQLLPEEERHEEFIAIYTDFPLSLGENDRGAHPGAERKYNQGAANKGIRISQTTPRDAVHLFVADGMN